MVCWTICSSLKHSLDWWLTEDMQVCRWLSDLHGCLTKPDCPPRMGAVHAAVQTQLLSLLDIWSMQQVLQGLASLKQCWHLHLGAWQKVSGGQGPVALIIPLERH